ncbi:MAG: insulinase family protein [Candidatus Dormibacteraeota bacterium]|nr:insulinase family protein [Candidatus Dormibacteraeota bacterium]
MVVSATGHTLEVLSGGARLVTAPLRERNSVSIAFMFKVGSRYEAPEVAGVSHFVEHMVFKGSEHFPTAMAVAESIEGIGGDLNAATDKELTMYWARVAGDQLEKAVDVITDIVQRPRFELEEAEKERDVILEELRMYLDSPADHVHTLFEEILWPDHQLGIDVAGTPDSVSRITVEAMREHMRRHYLASDLLIAVAGNVDHAHVHDYLNEKLELPSEEAPSFEPASPLTQGAVNILDRPTEQAHLVVGTRSISYTHPDRYAVDLMTTILGGGMSSRLFQEIRERLGLAYDIHSFSARLADSGAAGAYIGTEPAKAADALGKVMAEIRKMCDEPVDEEELTRAKNYVKGRLLLRLESTGAMAAYLGEQHILTGEILEPAELIDQIDAVTADDVRRVAHLTYAEQPLVLAAIGPIKDPRALTDLIEWSGNG